MSKGDKLRTYIDVLTQQIASCIQRQDRLFDKIDNIEKEALKLMKLRKELEQELSEMEEAADEQGR